MKSTPTKLKFIFGTLVLLSFLGTSVFGGKTANFLASIITGDYRADSGMTVIRLSEIGNPPDSLLVPYKNCSFNTEGKLSREKLIFKEIAWMGDERNHANEWIILEKIIPGELNISGWQVLNENERINIIIPQQTFLTDENPAFVLARNDKTENVKGDMLFTGAIRNTNEGLRLFDNECNLVDEVFATPNWPAGDNQTKAVMVRSVNLGWATAGESGSVAGVEDIKNCVDLNKSSLSELVRLIGVGEKTAESIVAYRVGAPFVSVYDLEKVSGIGPVTAERIKEQGIVCEGYIKEPIKSADEGLPENEKNVAVAENACININSAPKEELIKIIHIGESRAEEIMKIRTGDSFSSLDDLAKISGISETRVTDIKEQSLACVE